MNEKLGQQPAFATSAFGDGNGVYDPGMSTRLYIATMAMQGLCVGKEAKDIKLGHCVDIAELSLIIADELLNLENE